MAARNTQSNGSRCASEYPGGVTLAGRAIQCDDPRGTGHDGDHRNSFAARWWTDNQGPRGWGTPDRSDPSESLGPVVNPDGTPTAVTLSMLTGVPFDSIRADQERERAIAATPANPSGGPFPLRRPDRGRALVCGDCWAILRPDQYEPLGGSDSGDDCSCCGALLGGLHRVSWAEVDRERATWPSPAPTAEPVARWYCQHCGAAIPELMHPAGDSRCTGAEDGWHVWRLTDQDPDAEPCPVTGWHWHSSENRSAQHGCSIRGQHSEHWYTGHIGGQTVRLPD